MKSGCLFAALLACSGMARAQIVADGGFEVSGPAFPGGPWAQFSTNFGTPLCDSSCFNPPTVTGAHSGQWWAWFGGEPFAIEHGTLTQTVTFPAGNPASLEFYLNCYTEQSNGTDYLKVFIDNVEVWSINDQQMAPFSIDYAVVAVSLAAFGPGPHVLKFDSQTNGGGFLTNIWVDDVAISADPPSTCYPNCDNSTATPVLNALDFSCYLTRFAAQTTYANCDGSTQSPVLNALDFSCFLSRYAAGCS